ncbi:MAG: recombinase family protein [Paraclostridium sp.]
MKFGYARVSTTDQNAEAQVLELQRIGCEDIRIETMSGLIKERPILNELLQQLRRGDSLYVTRVDRLGRQTRQLLQTVEDLMKKGVQLVFIHESIDTETASGQMLLTVLSAIAQFETSIRSERQKEGIALAKAKGVYKKKKCITHPLLHECLKLYDNGLSPYAISKILPMAHSTAWRIVKLYRQQNMEPK